MRKGLAAAGVVALISVGSAACGSDTTTPQGKVSNAFEKLGKQNTVTLSLGFDGSADDIYAALKDEDDFTRDNAKLLSSLHLSLSVSSQKSFSLLGKDAGKAGKDGKDSAVAFSLSDDDAGSSSLAEIRYVDQKAYLRIDLKGLEKLDPSGGKNATLDQLTSQADQLPASLASVKAALKGQWVSIDPKSFQQFAKSMGGSSSGSGSSDSTDSPLSGLSGTPSVDAATQKKVMAALKKALATNVTYKDLGNRDGADHVQVTAPARQLAQAISDSLKPVLKDVPGFDPKSLDPTKVPNKTMSVDVAIKGGSLSAVTFDVAQLDTQAHGKLPLTLSLDGSAQSISAPKGAQVLNPQDIMGLFMSGLPGANDDSTSGL